MFLGNVIVACTALRGELIIGRRNKANTMLTAKRPAEPEIMTAVVQHMMHDCPRGASKDISPDGVHWFRITVQPITEPIERK